MSIKYKEEKDFIIEGKCDHYFAINKNGKLLPCEFCGREKKILSIYSQFDKEPYLLGQKAKETDKNPFEKNTNSWYNWNKGRNENLLNKI